MPIRSDELFFKYSTATGPGNSSTGAAATSLGGFISTTVVPVALNNIFDDISGVENAADQVDYRCVFLHNNSAQNLPLQNATLWLAMKDSYGAFISLGADPTGSTQLAESAGQAVTIPDSLTAPAAVTFVDTALSYETGISLGNINAGECAAFWYRRTARNTTSLDRDSVSIRVQGASLF